jgi:hypothetical protein
VLLLLLGIEWLPAGDVVLPPASRPKRATHAPVTLESKETALWARAIIARPLFSTSRRPPKGKQTVTGTDTTLPRLAGIMITKAGRRAIFMPEGGKSATLAEGATLEDNTIRQIRADYVVLSGPKGDFILRPSYDKQRVGGFVPGGVAGFQPPGFQPPGFPQQGFNPGFPNGFNPALNTQPFQPPQPAPAPANDEPGDTNATPPPPPPQVPFPGFRGPLPHGRP